MIQTKEELEVQNLTPIEEKEKKSIKKPIKKLTDKQKKQIKRDTLMSTYGKKVEFVAMGIDQGINHTGLSVVTQNDKRELSLIHYDQITCKTKWSDGEKLQHIETALLHLFATYHNQVDMVCIEKLFLDFGPRLKTGVLKTAYATGLIYKIAHQYGIPVMEVSSKQMKGTVTMDGQADKNAIIKGIKTQFPLQSFPKLTEHMADAIGFSITGPRLVWEAYEETENERLKQIEKERVKIERERLKQEKEKEREKKRIEREKKREEKLALAKQKALRVQSK